MVGLLSGECVLPRVVIAYFDENVGYVFNQVFCPVGASVFAGVFLRIFPRPRLFSNLPVGASWARDSLKNA